VASRTVRRSSGAHTSTIDILRPGNRRLHDHLGNALAAERLGADEILALDGSQEVADASEREEHASRDQARAAEDDAEELHDGKDGIGGGAHVVGRDPADGGVELGRGRADAQQEGNFDEDDDEGGGSGRDRLAGRPTSKSKGGIRDCTYMQRAQKMMIKGLKVKIFAIPTAKQTIIEITPSLLRCRVSP
jgi:hypothetical protein